MTRGTVTGNAPDSRSMRARAPVARQSQHEDWMALLARVYPTMPDQWRTITAALLTVHEAGPDG